MRKLYQKKEKGMYEKIDETVSALCEWIKNELKTASSSQTESILPTVIEATAKLINSTKF